MGRTRAASSPCLIFTEPIARQLVAPAKRALLECKRTLIEAHAQATGDVNGFLYGGVYHTELSPKHIRSVKKTLIHVSLRARAQAYSDACRAQEREKILILNGLSTILRYCFTFQDARDMLPSFLIQGVPELASLPRTRPEGFLYEGKPLAQEQFQHILRLLELHASNRIL
jgi:hypothetical protein